MRILPLLSLILSGSILGCSSGAYCERNSKCKSQPPTDRSDGGACAAALSQYPQCKSRNEAWLNCQLDHEVCTPDGKTDPNGTAGYAASQCTGQRKDLDTCLATDGGAK